MRMPLCVVAVFVCAGAFAQSVSLDGLIKYSPPKGFKRDDSRVGQGRKAFFGPEANNYSPSVVFKSFAPGKSSAAEVGKQAIASMKSQPDMKVLGSREFKMAGQPTFQINLEMHLDNGMQVSQHLLVSTRKGKGYILTMSALKQTAKRYFPLFEKSLKSIVWIN